MSDMYKLPIYQVDAFTDQLFKGNPAAVCILKEWLPAELMQQIAAENNLAETAFLVFQNDLVEIRWFTPTVEVDLCGHATLASAFVLFNSLNFPTSEINFFSFRSGKLKVAKQDDTFYLDFPTDKLIKQDDTAKIGACIGIEPLEVYKGKSDYLAVVERENELVNLNPVFPEIAKLQGRGLVVTAQGNEVDFVSRFFAPQSGIPEDPVTGSAHTSLIPYWSGKLGKKEMSARQLSERGGTLICEFRGERCRIGGKAKLYLTGELNID